MRIEPIRQQGYELLHDGVLELAQVEANGIRVDLPRLKRTKEELGTKIRTLRQDLLGSDLWKVWHKRFGSSSNLTSDEQLATVLFDKMGYPVTNRTESGKPATDEEALMKVDHPLIPKLIRFKKYNKALGTFITGIEREICGDRLHPVFNLHTVVTYRGSSDTPNFQNFPVRDKEVAEIIRRLFIGSPGCLLGENDFKGIEVSVSACYHQDENFISYITTPGKDMHRDMAAQIYMLDPKQVHKDARYGAKNKFVFPQFYGDFYVACARNLWEWIEKGKLAGPDGKTSLFEHLRAKGITKLGKCNPEEEPVKGTFEHHLYKVEDDFWNNRFRDYGQWRRDWFKTYQEKGYFDMFTGFRVYGTFKRNQVTNAPIQGSAFHCLLWSLIQINRALRRYRMKTRIVGQIHDSLISDIYAKELRDYLCIVEEVTTVKLRKAFDWLIVPLEIEYELCPTDGSWFEKKETKFKQGAFQHPKDPSRFTTNPEAFIKILNQRN